MLPILSLLAALVLFSTTSFAQGNTPQTQDSTRSSTQPLGTTTPGEYPFTPEQDRQFYQALSQYVIGAVRFRFDAQRTTVQRINEAMFGTLSESIAGRNMDFSYEMFTPNSRANRLYVRDRLASFDIAGVRSSSHIQGIDREEEESARKLREFFGIKEDISANVMDKSYKFLEMLGLRENVSPQLEYTLEQESLVDVWIISLESRQIKHLLSARQPEGTHTITWNGTNDDNLRMPRGYYIGQVFADKKRILQKGIRW